MKDILLGQNALSLTKSYTYLGHIIIDNLCDEPDIKAKVGCIYGRSNILLRNSTFVLNVRRIGYFPIIVVICICVNCGPIIIIKSSICHFIVSYNNAYRILHNLPMRCSAILYVCVFSNTCLCVRKCIFSL